MRWNRSVWLKRGKERASRTECRLTEDGSMFAMILQRYTAYVQRMLSVGNGFRWTDKITSRPVMAGSPKHVSSQPLGIHVVHQPISRKIMASFESIAAPAPTWVWAGTFAIPYLIAYLVHFPGTRLIRLGLFPLGVVCAGWLVMTIHLTVEPRKFRKGHECSGRWNHLLNLSARLGHSRNSCKWRAKTWFG